MRRRLTSVFRNLCGFLLILLGVAGILLPILPGVVFLIPGLALLDHPAKGRVHRWCAARCRAYRGLALLSLRTLRRTRRSAR